MATASGGGYRGDESLRKIVDELSREAQQLRSRFTRDEVRHVLVKVQPNEPPGPTGTIWLDLSAGVSTASVSVAYPLKVKLWDAAWDIVAWMTPDS